jgi:predicted ATPase
MFSAREHATRRRALVMPGNGHRAASVSAVIASSLGMVAQGREQPLDTLIRRLADRQILIVLDNFEQVHVARRWWPTCCSAPRLHLLITSRVVLQVRSERE